MKISRFALALLLTATSAQALDAPANWPLTKIEKDAAISGLPYLPLKWDARNHPLSYALHFQNGQQIQGTQALDGTFRLPTDPRLTINNVTCSVFVDNAPGPSTPTPFIMYDQNHKPIQRPAPAAPTTYSPIPPVIFLTEKPAVEVGSNDTTTLQRFQSPYAWTDPATHLINSGRLVCYKVGALPFTAGDVMHAFGGNLQFQLSAAQTTDLMNDQSMRNLLSGASQSLGGSGIQDGMSPKSIFGVPNGGTFDFSHQNGQRPLQ